MLDERISDLDRFEPAQRVMYTGLGLYGLRPARADWLQPVLDRALREFARFNCVPTLVGSDVFADYKLRSYSRSFGRVRSKLKEVNSVEVYCVPEGTPDRHLAEARFGWMRWRYDTAITPGAHSHYTLEKNVLLFIFRSSILPARGLELVEFAREIISLVQPVYGIVYDVPVAYDPGSYGYGFQFNGSGRAVQDWGEVQKFELHRFLRNVYRWNLLTEIHLTATVGELPLADWIRRDHTRGKISPFAEGMVLWTVEAGNIAGVRKQLDEVGLFYGYDRHLMPIVQKYRCSEVAAAEYLRTGKEPVYTPLDPSKPPLDMETVLQSFGVGECEQDVLRVETGGKLHKLSDQEIQKVAGRKPSMQKNKKK